MCVCVCVLAGGGRELQFLPVLIRRFPRQTEMKHSTFWTTKVVAKLSKSQACQLSLYRSESQDFTTDLKFSLLCCKYSLQVHLATCVCTKIYVKVLIVLGEAEQH